MGRKFKLSQTSLNKIEKYVQLNEFIDENADKLLNQIVYDVKMIKDCAENSIVDFYLETCSKLLKTRKDQFSDKFMEDLKMQTRHKLVNKYVSTKTFDNNIDIYFNEVKREYI